MLTPSVHAMEDNVQAELLAKVRGYAAFKPDNDPHQEHDFGSVEHAGETLFWKIDYYDPNLVSGSEDPADPTKTARVMTLMRADEY